MLTDKRKTVVPADHPTEGNTMSGFPRGPIAIVATGLAVAGAVAAGAAFSSGGNGASEHGATSASQQLIINQRISQAAVRRSNSALNYLAAIRTAATDAINTGRNGVTPLPQVTGAGQGWTQSNLNHPVYAGAISAAGTVGPGGTALSAQFSAPGTYAVTFPVNVSQCTATATPSADPGANPDNQIHLYAAPTAGNAQAITVVVRNGLGASVAAPFNLVVAC